MAPDPIEELGDFLADNWDPDLSVGEWWRRLGEAGWSAPMLPPAAGGRGLTRGDALRVLSTITDRGALGPPAGLGLSLAAPTIAAHGTPEQIARYVPDIVTGRRAWCQLFSEPGAGSDLAGLSTRAVRDGDVWVINGQKVWTSGGNFADLGMLLARTNPHAPKHQGISWFAFPMHQPGVEVRPLREMTGQAMFCEVFFTDALVADTERVGDLNDGWRVANTTLQVERSGMGAGSDAPRGSLMARPGTVAGDLDKRAGDFVRTRPTASGPSEAANPATAFIDLARRYGRSADPLVRQDLVRLYTWRELARLNVERHKAVRARGGDIPGLANFSKLAMGHVMRLQRDLGLRILGNRGTLHAYDDAERTVLAADPAYPLAQPITFQALGAQALPIFGGTDQIQRNIISERALGLPKEPGDLSKVPFDQLPRNG